MHPLRRVSAIDQVAGRIMIWVVKVSKHSTTFLTGLQDHKIYDVPMIEGANNFYLNFNTRRLKTEASSSFL